MKDNEKRMLLKQWVSGFMGGIFAFMVMFNMGAWASVSNGLSSTDQAKLAKLVVRGPNIGPADGVAFEFANGGMFAGNDGDDLEISLGDDPAEDDFRVKEHVDDGGSELVGVYTLGGNNIFFRNSNGTAVMGTGDVINGVTLYYGANVSSGKTIKTPTVETATGDPVMMTHGWQLPNGAKMIGPSGATANYTNPTEAYGTTWTDDVSSAFGLTLDTSGNLSITAPLDVQAMLTYGPEADVTVASGVVAASHLAVLHDIAGEGATTDDIDTITASTRFTESYHVIGVRAASSGYTVTLKNGTGNLNLGSDVPLSASAYTFLVFDNDLDEWQQL